jgi:hypothetical protein
MTENETTGIIPKNWKYDPELFDSLPEMIKSQPIFKKAFKIPILIKLLGISDDLVL